MKIYKQHQSVSMSMMNSFSYCKKTNVLTLS